VTQEEALGNKGCKYFLHSSMNQANWDAGEAELHFFSLSFSVAKYASETNSFIE
jgi:hypothetical protein